MPVSSHQVGGLIGGQQAMFGNFASYSQQISPYGGGGGPMPTYSNPMAGMGEMMQPPPAPHAESHHMAERFGTGAVGMLGHVPTAIGGIGMAASIGGMMGSRALGAVGTAAGAFDPFTAGMGGFARGIGWQSGAGIGANLGRLGSMGVGGIARAGLAGLGGAAIAAAPALIATEAIRYGAGQMVEGAQYQNQVGSVLQNQFRFMNPGGTGGRGFGTQERQGISNMMREMGHNEMMSSPGEMLRLLQQGTGTGMFKAVSDAKEFRKKFQEMVGTLKEVAKTMNTTLEGAMPFMASARQQGFWTPQDIMKNAQATRTTAAASGLSVAQVQSMTMQGAQMARSVGAMGQTGAKGMLRSMDVASGMVGGPGRAGILSEEQVGELTGGLQGPEAVAALAQNMQASATRFAKSNVARWTIAALGRDKFSQLDPAKVRALSEGRMSIGDIGGGARGNIGRGGAANFVMNEEKLRGQLIEMGPQGQMGFVAGLVGSRLYSEKPMDQYVTRRLLKRFGMGETSKEADAMAKVMRGLPRMMQEMTARGNLDADQQERNQDEQLNRSWDGVKRQMGKWWDRNVKEPLQKLGADVASEVSHAFETVSDKLFGRVAQRHRFGAVGKSAAGAFQTALLTGNTKLMDREFGSGGGPSVTGLNVLGDQGNQGGIMSALTGRSSSDTANWMRQMGVKEYGYKTAAERDAAVGGGGLVSGGRRGIGLLGLAAPGVGLALAARKAQQTFGESYAGDYRAFDAEDSRGAADSYDAAVAGKVTTSGQATGLGFQTKEGAQYLIGGARKGMDTKFQIDAQRFAQSSGKKGRELLQEYTKQIKAGKLGGEKLKEYIEGGKEGWQQEHRLAAALPEDMRGEGMGQVDLRGEGKQVDYTRLKEGDLAEEAKKQEGKFAETIQGKEGWAEKYGRAQIAAHKWTPHGWAVARAIEKILPSRVTGNSVGEVRRKGGPELAAAMRVLGDKNATEAEKNEAKDKILAIKKDPANGFKDDEHKVLLGILDPSKAGQDVRGELNEVYKQKQSAELMDVVDRRAKRMEAELGSPEGRTKMMAAIRGEKGAEGMASLLSDLTKVGGSKDPEEYRQKLSQLAEEAVKAGPEVAEKVAAQLDATGSGGAHLRQLVSRAGAVKRESKAIVKGGAEGAQASYGLVADLVGGEKAEANRGAIRDLQSNDLKKREAAKKKILAGIDTSTDAGKFTADAIDAIGSKNEKALERALTGTARASGGRSLLGAEQIQKMEKATKMAKGEELFGRLGSKEGMHQVAAKTNSLLEQLIRVTAESAGKSAVKDAKSGDYTVK